MALEGATILITGGTGSFGRRIAGDLARRGVGEIRIFSRDEKKQHDMALANPSFRFIVGDVRDRQRLDEAMRGVDFVFHAAALKQVPGCEIAPVEAVKTNTLGSLNVCEAASASGVRTLVALSTDKAVKPINAMGMSKALMEKIVCARNLYETGTTFACVRYGNVMGSRGSVIPLFRDQIRRGVPLTVTIPEMTRFLMTLDQSVDLVYHALSSAQGGEVFVRKAPASTVWDLAKAMCARYSELGESHPIDVIGSRAAEKVHEVLVSEYEMQRSTSVSDYFVIQPDYRPLADGPRAPVGAEFTSENTERLVRHEDIIALLERMGDIEHYA